MSNICITLPKSVNWSDYEKELDKVKDGKEEMSFRLPTLPKDVKPGDRCYVCHDGFVKGWMAITKIGHKSAFNCTTTGENWPEGNYVSRSGEFHYLENPIPMKGFQGYRKFEETGLEESVQELGAMHASKANFNKFDTNFINTGCGSQVYGWGFYVATDMSVAKGYWDNALETSTPFEDINGYYYQKGYLYHVEIPDDNGHNYITWTEKPPENVFNFFVKWGGITTDADIKYMKRLTYGELYNGWVPNGDPERPRIFSETLYNMGYTGIKVPSYHNNGNDSYEGCNYVLFNPDDIKIYHDRTEVATSEPRIGPNRALEMVANGEKIDDVFFTSRQYTDGMYFVVLEDFGINILDIKKMKYLWNGKWFRVIKKPSDGWMVVTMNTESGVVYNFLNFNGNLMFDKGMLYCDTFRDGMSVVEDKEKNYYFINSRGEKIRPDLEYTPTYLLDGGYSEFRFNDEKHREKYGDNTYLMDRNGVVYDYNKQPIPELNNMDNLNEAFNTGFRLDELNKIKSFKGKLQYCQRNLGPKFGQGSSRVIFDFTDEAVLKLAYNQKGIAQNENECDMSRNNKRVVVHCFDNAPDYSWIIQENVLPAKAKDFEECLGITWDDFQRFVCACYKRYGTDKRAAYTAMDETEYNYYIETHPHSDWFTDFSDYMANWELPYGDLTRLSSYGMVNRDGNVTIVVLDSGLTYEVLNDYYRRNSMNETVEEMLTYHSSNADFENFDLKFAETGCGSMVFGYGVYVATDPEVAAGYWKSAVLNLEKTGVALSRNMAVKYIVDIPEDNGENYLDWDGPAYNFQELTGVDDRGTSYTFGNTYETAVRRLRTVGSKYASSQKKVSMFLSSKGYTGIKVVGFRNSGGNGKYNYVVFKESDCKILKKERFGKNINGNSGYNSASDRIDNESYKTISSLSNGKKVVKYGDAYYNVIENNGKPRFNEWFISCTPIDKHFTKGRFENYFIVTDSHRYQNVLTPEGNLLSMNWYYWIAGPYLLQATNRDIVFFVVADRNRNENALSITGRLILDKWVPMDESSLGEIKMRIVRTLQMGLFENVNENISIKMFEPKDELNPKFWVNNKLNSKVRMRLLDIADDFVKTLDIRWVKPEDIVLTGSIANYNWTKFSDVDIHIIMDFKKVYKKTDFVKNYFDAKKEEWNSSHEGLKIYGFNVELSVEDKNEPAVASGVYSLEKNDWISEPKDLSDAKLNKDYVETTAESYIKKIDDLDRRIRKEKDAKKVETLSNKMISIFNKLKGMRKEGLKSKSKEMSSGNIVWKILRAEGYIKKIWDIVNYNYDKSMSLNEKNILKESNMSGVYHFMDVNSLLRALSTGKFELNPEEQRYHSKYKYFLSTTRQRNSVQGFPYMCSDYGMGGTYHNNASENIIVRVELNPAKMTKYGTFKPFDWLYQQTVEDSGEYGDNIVNGKQDSMDSPDENERYHQPFAQSEERFLSNLPEIPFDKNTVVRIDVYVKPKHRWSSENVSDSENISKIANLADKGIVNLYSDRGNFDHQYNINERMGIKEAVTGKDNKNAAALYVYALDEKGGEWHLLCARRTNRKGDEEGGKWNPPMGHLHRGEDMVDGAIRECLEESGVDFSECKSKIKLMDSHRWGNNYRLVLKDKYTSDFKPGNGDEENDDFIWLPVGDIKEKTWAYTCGENAEKYIPKTIRLSEEQRKLIREMVGNENGTITLFHGVSYNNLEYNLKNGGFAPRVCAEGGPEAVWLSEQQYPYHFTFKFAFPKQLLGKKLIQQSNVDYTYNDFISFNDFGCELVKTTIYQHGKGFAVEIDLMDEEMCRNQFKFMPEIYKEFNERMKQFPLVYEKYVKPVLEKIGVLNDGLRENKHVVILREEQLEGVAPGYRELYLNSYKSRFRERTQIPDLETYQLHYVMQKLNIPQIKGKRGCYTIENINFLLDRPDTVRKILGYEPLEKETVPTPKKITVNNKPFTGKPDYTPPLSIMKNASEELLKKDDIYI